MELCPDAPGDNDLRPGTWTRRHRSQVVSVRNLAKSNSKEHAEPSARTTPVPTPARLAMQSRPSRIKESVCEYANRNIFVIGEQTVAVDDGPSPTGRERGSFVIEPRTTR